MNLRSYENTEEAEAMLEVIVEESAQKAPFFLLLHFTVIACPVKDQNDDIYDGNGNSLS